MSKLFENIISFLVQVAIGGFITYLSLESFMSDGWMPDKLGWDYDCIGCTDSGNVVLPVLMHGLIKPIPILYSLGLIGYFSGILGYLLGELMNDLFTSFFLASLPRVVLLANVSLVGLVIGINELLTKYFIPLLDTSTGTKAVFSLGLIISIVCTVEGAKWATSDLTFPNKY